MLFPQIRIERPDVPVSVDVQLNRRIRHLEKPRLGIMRTRGQNRSPHQPQGSIVRILAPVFPRFVSRTFTDAEDTLIVRPPDSTADHGHGDDSRALEKKSALHKASPVPQQPTTILVFSITDFTKAFTSTS